MRSQLNACITLRSALVGLAIATIPIALDRPPVGAFEGDRGSPLSGPAAQSQSTCAGDADSDGQVSIDELVRGVRNALLGCPNPEPEEPQLTLRVDRGEEGGVRIVAEVRNAADAAVSYLGGCSALCRPLLFTPVYFTVLAPSGAEAFIERPCSGPYFCAPIPLVLDPGDRLEQTLAVAGTEWRQEGESLTYCGECAERPLDAGRYTVVARFLYSTDLVQPISLSQQVVAVTEFNWP